MKLRHLLALTFVALPGCNGSGTIPPATAGGIFNGVELALCVFDNYATDTNAGMTPIATVADIVVKCRTDEVTVANLLAAHKRAAQAEAAHPAK